MEHLEEQSDVLSLEKYKLLERIKLELIEYTNIHVSVVTLNSDANGLTAHYLPNVRKTQIDYANGILSNLFIKYKDSLLKYDDE